MKDMSIEYVALSSVLPYKDNARIHSESDLSAIKSSIEQFGFNDPIAVWGDDNVIVEGHGRYLVAMELGIEKIPIIHLDHLTDNERRAYALVHNKTAELSSWDYSVLESELSELTDVDLKSIGFEETTQSIDGFDELFNIKEKTKKDQKKKIYCIYCGEWFEVE